jgi:hypothetical protein
MLLYAVGGAALLSLVGNAALCFLFLRRRLRLKAGASGAGGIRAPI